VPVVPDLPQKLLNAVMHDPDSLNMSKWHTCDTTHCRAGWYVHFAGKAGYELEDRYGPWVAGALIYAASCPGRPMPDFFSSTKEAWVSIREDAEVQ
jgi:hypothetical protein